MTKRKKLSAILLGAILALGVGAGLAPKNIAGAKAASWTEATSITSGSKYLITVGDYYLPTAEVAGGPPSAVNFTNVSSVLETQGWKFTASSDGWIITHDFGGAKEIELYNTDTNNGVKYRQLAATPQVWTAVYSSNSFLFTGANSRNLALYNTQDWRSYSSASGTKTIKLFKLGESVNVPVTGIDLNKSSMTIMTDTSEQLTATVSPSDASNPTVNWTSTNSAIASVSNGLVTGVSVGTATITATTVVGGFEKTCLVTVEQNTMVIDKFSVKGFGGYTGGFDSEDHTGTVGTANTTLALRVYNGGTGAVRGNQTGIAANFSARNTTPYPGFIRKIVLNGTGGTNFTASADRSLVNVGSTPYTLDNATNGTKVQGVYTSGGGVHTLTWDIPSGIDCRFFILHNLQAAGTMLAAAADSFQIYYEPAEIEFGVLDHIELDTTSTSLQKTYFVGESIKTNGLVVTAYDENDKDLITTNYTTDPSAEYKFTQSDLGTATITITVTMDGVPASDSYDVEVLLPRKFVKVAAESGITTGKIYSMASVLGSAASTSHVTAATPFANVVGVDYNEENNSFLEVSNLQTVELVAGFQNKGYAIKLLSGEHADKYYGWDSGNSLRLENAVAITSSWFITIDEGVMRIENANDATRFIAHNFTSPRFATYENIPNNGAMVGLYEVDTGINPDIAVVDDFVDTYMFMDEIEVTDKGTGECKSEGLYADAKAAFNALSATQRALFVTDAQYDAPRARLLSWADANNEGLITATNTLGVIVSPSQNAFFNGLNDSNTIMLIVIISLISVSVLGGVFYLRKKEQN